MRIKRIATISIIILAVLLSGYFLFRGYILQKAIQKIVSKVHDKFHAELVIKDASFESFARVKMDQVMLISPLKDTLFYAHDAAAAISFIRYFKGLPPVNNIVLNDGQIYLKENADSSNNYSFLLKRNSTDTDSISSNNKRSNYQELINGLWNRFFSLADFNFKITNFNIKWEAPRFTELLAIDEFRLQKTILTFKAVDKSNQDTVHWNINGKVDASSNMLNLEGSNNSSRMKEIPFSQKLIGFICYVQSFSLDANKVNSGSIHLIAGAREAGINHWRISPEDVILHHVKVDLKLNISPNSIEIDSSSHFVINQLPLQTGISYSNDQSKKINISMVIPETPGDTFFNSLPDGLFQGLKGIKTTGTLNYHMNFSVDMSNPDALIFNSEMQKHNFRIVKFGEENLSSINGTFQYAAKEKDRIVKVFLVGPENPEFTPFDQINPYLVNSVLTSEDGTFFYHRGFNEDAFRESIATNIKEKRFARGGSTITMQLVKNVFLNRNKTISRKLEEAIMVWLIENCGLVSKTRMLEVYLNIIEWGPGVYGIGDASRFYFDKKPADLNLEESIFLASIIPNPKLFRYSFDKQGNLKEYLSGYFNLIAGHLVKKEIITQTQFDSLQHNVMLKGPAMELVIPSDTIPNDTVPDTDDGVLFDDL